MPSERRSIGEVARDWLGAATDVLNRGLVAGVVGAPVDIASTVLRPFVPGIGDAPVGGSEWIGNKMQQAGIVSSKRRPIAEFAASLIDPATAPAAIAKGASLGAAKLSMLPLAIGQTVWHGSPHKFEKFDSSKIGTGEGAQAYGHGLYFAESPDVAQQYQKQLGTTMTVDGQPLLSGGRVQGTTGNKELDGLLELYGGDMKQAIRDQLGIIRDSRYRLSLPEAQSETVQRLNKAALKSHQRLLADMKGVRDKAVVRQDGSLYKVDLPDEAIAKMLDWDKPLSQQAPEVRKALDGVDLSQVNKRIAKLVQNGEADGQTIYKAFGSWDNPSGAANALRQAGIPGIRYLDGSSRGTGQGTSNFVIFPGNEDLLTILERNGVPIVPDSK